ncbi:hypothetical protein EDD68_11740 [Melghiribacillus thermohalophilus]|uniref:Uncharacterized protein n=1 Tax=Melghiribacillus thermohalophilus TaxID=1324956 RepID=A0A4R3MVW2_9BACI|nr:hypothetical protein [Melghiribacillus thermohalophilus]TCT19646.1 hypothetical protein EDD68_11740 [Melghiribacillus thermohalophilus]
MAKVNWKCMIILGGLTGAIIIAADQRLRKELKERIPELSSLFREYQQHPSTAVRHLRKAIDQLDERFDEGVYMLQRISRKLDEFVNRAL